MRTACLLVSALLLAASDLAAQQDYYVSANRGSGRKGTKDSPVKNIGNLLKKLEAGDTIHIANGIYQGKSNAGFVGLEIPVKIIGGYDDTFTKRDPWGAHKTILSGDNKSKNWSNAVRLGFSLKKFNREKRMEFLRAKEIKVHEILVDGIIVDNAGRNRYASEKQVLIVRKANPGTGENPTPDRAGIFIEAPIHGKVTIQNCIIMNCAPTEGALTVFGNQGSKAVIRNNLVINNTGVGIFASTGWHPRDGQEIAQFSVEHNTVLYTEKYDAYGTINGHAFKLDSDTHIDARQNVFAFSDQNGVMSATRSKYKQLTLAQNLVYGNLGADLLEFDTAIDVDCWEDDSEELSDNSEGNVSDAIEVPISKTWADRYMSRAIIDLNAAEADKKPRGTQINEVRQMSRLPRQAADLTLDSNVWLPRLSIEDAVKAGTNSYKGKHGCNKP